MARRGVRGVVVVVVVDMCLFAFPREDAARSRPEPRGDARARGAGRSVALKRTLSTHFFPRGVARARDAPRVARRARGANESQRASDAEKDARGAASTMCFLRDARDARAMSLLNDENIAPRNRRANDATPSAPLAREDAPMKKTPRCDGTF